MIELSSGGHGTTPHQISLHPRVQTVKTTPFCVSFLPVYQPAPIPEEVRKRGEGAEEANNSFEKHFSPNQSPLLPGFVTRKEKQPRKRKKKSEYKQAKEYREELEEPFNGRTSGSGNEHRDHRTSWAPCDGCRRRGVCGRTGQEPA